MGEDFPLDKQAMVLAENLVVKAGEIEIKCARRMEPGCVTIDGKPVDGPLYRVTLDWDVGGMPSVGLFFRGA